MALPLHTYTPKPPEPPREDYAGLEELDRPELDDYLVPLDGDDAPDTERDPVPPLPPLDWDDDGESGIKRRR